MEPDWNALPAATPPAIRAILKRCLHKDRRERFHAIGDVRIELQQFQNAPAAGSVTQPRKRDRAAWTAFLIAGVVAVAAFKLPLNLGLLTASLCGVIAGMLVEAKS